MLSNKKNIFVIRFTYLIFTVLFFLISACTENSIEPSASPIDEFTQIDFEPSWSSGANKIAYVHSNIDGKFTGIYVINSDGTNNTKIVNDFARCPDWSSDDRWIAFSQFENIYKIRNDNDSIVQLTHEGKNYFPKWSPDNMRIAYCNSDNSSFYNLFIMKSDGTEKTLIEENANYPGWVNLNTLIYFKPFYINSSQTGDTLIRYFFNTNSRQTITVLSGDEHKVNMYPLFAGDQIIFCSMNNRGSVYIYSMSSDGSNIVKLTEAQSYSPDYSFANQKIIYTNRSKGNGRIWKMDKNGNNKTQITF